MTVTLTPRFWRVIADWFRAEIMLLLAMIVICLAVRLTAAIPAGIGGSPCGRVRFPNPGRFHLVCKMRNA